MKEAQRAARTEAAEKLRDSIDWSKYPVLARCFRQRPPQNILWQELAQLIRDQRAEVVDGQALADCCWCGQPSRWDGGWCGQCDVPDDAPIKLAYARKLIDARAHELGSTAHPLGPIAALAAKSGSCETLPVWQAPHPQPAPAPKRKR